jgi:hypothetical protein
MATVLYARTAVTAPLVTPYRNHLPLFNSVSVGSASTLDASSVDTATNERQFTVGDVPESFWSGRVVSQHTQTGTLQVLVYAKQLVADADLRLRARLFKITAGGSDVESLIASLDATSSLTTSVVGYTLSGAIPVAVTIVPNERFILRLYVFPFTGGWGSGTPVAQVQYDSTAEQTHVAVPVSVVCKDNDGPLHFRRTQDIAIGDFVDMTVALGSTASTTSDVATSASGTEIQWTRLQQVGTVAVTEITGAVIASTSNASTYVSASFTPVADRLYLLAVAHADASPEATVPTIATTTGLAFTLMAAPAFNTISTNINRLTLFRAMKPSGLSNGTYTVTFGDSSTGCAALLAEVTGVVTTGTNGADAVSGVTPVNTDAGANPSLTVGGSDRPYVNDGIFACFGSSLQTAPTAGSGYTPLSHPDYSNPDTGLFAEWRNTPATTASCTLASSNWAAVCCRLVAVTTTTPFEWIGPRFKAGWAAETADQFAGSVWASEDLGDANCALRVKIFRRQPDGTESQIYEKTGAELSTGAAIVSIAGGTVTPTFCNEDDRLIVRCYITNVGTMAGGHICTLYYDHNVAAGAGDSFLTFVGLPDFKDEGDPLGTSRVTDGQSLSGIGN